jgi:hypothetical protein
MKVKVEWDITLPYSKLDSLPKETIVPDSEENVLEYLTNKFGESATDYIDIDVLE